MVFQALIPLAVGAVQGAQKEKKENLNRALGNVRNTFSIFTGGPRQNISSFTNTANDSLFNGLAASANQFDQIRLQGQRDAANTQRNNQLQNLIFGGGAAGAPLAQNFNAFGSNNPALQQALNIGLTQGIA